MTEHIGTGVTESKGTQGSSGVRRPYVKPFIVDLDAIESEGKRFASGETTTFGTLGPS